MPRSISKREPESVQDSGKFDLNYVHELLSRLEKVFQKAEGEIKGTLVKTAIAEITGMTKRLSGDPSIPLMDRFNAMQALQEIVAQEEARLFVPMPKTAPRLWNDRDDQNADPYVWAHGIYGDAARFAVVSDFAKIDRPLESALNMYRRRKGPAPVGYEIPTKSERDVAENSTHISWADLVQQAPPSLRRKLRAYRVQLGRKNTP